MLVNMSHVSHSSHSSHLSHGTYGPYGTVLLKQLSGVQDLFRAGPHPTVLSHQAPTDYATSINQAFSGAGNVVSIRTPTFMAEIVKRNHLHVRSGRQGEGVSSLLRQVARTRRT